METERLILRQYSLSDADDIFRNWVTDPEVSRFWTWEPHERIEETKALLAGWIDAYSSPYTYHWVLVLKATSQAIGYIYLDDIDDEESSATIHFLLSRRYWNKGLMTEACRCVLDFAFSVLETQEVHTHHHIDNSASGKVLTKSGMKYVKTEHRSIPECERISGDYCYYQNARKTPNFSHGDISASPQSFSLTRTRASYMIHSKQI